MRHVLLYEPDYDLQDNIIELLELEGFRIKPVTPWDLFSHNIPEKNKQVAFLCNGTSQSELFWAWEKCNYDYVPLILYGNDIQDIPFQYYDAWISLPFSGDQLVEIIDVILSTRKSMRDRVNYKL